ncbi:hypothetical protein P0W64_07515 [Tsukamurella sp. 8F]|uniref:hypothetical protein n=1 Tax=unclassified Tsukamurella TaxID=2633480 RepID=UPI0023B9A82B|nr:MULTISPECIES: hypothetical protein [unclassified Tsukamurella]MDF0528783.1 hypothetical protein [Tsukamurella sp. 8J]MDF0586618.1 hypothetical protein [Tsukamurella sp. 8F]
MTGSRPPTVVLIHGGSHAQLATLADPALAPYRIRPLHVRTSAVTEIDDAEVVIVADRLRPDLLERWTDALLACLGDDRTLIVYGENNVGDWIPGVTEQRRPTDFWWWRTGEDSRIRPAAPEHPAWHYFSERAVVWHYHGVLTSPPGALSLVDLHTPEGTVDGSILTLDDANHHGRLLITTMDPIYHHGSGFMPGATQLLYSSLHWATR